MNSQQLCLPASPAKDQVNQYSMVIGRESWSHRSNWEVVNDMKGCSVFFKDVAFGRSTTLWWMALHPWLYGQYKLHFAWYFIKINLLKYFYLLLMWSERKDVAKHECGGQRTSMWDQSFLSYLGLKGSNLAHECYKVNLYLLSHLFVNYSFLYHLQSKYIIKSI